MENRRLAFLFILSSFLLSCQKKEIAFESEKWNQKYDGFYDYREFMVKDLIENHLNPKLSYQEVMKKLGKPDYVIDSIDLTIAYQISEKYGLNIDPIETKTLLIYFNKDSITQKSEIRHYKK